jgi:hypothetical protein
MIVAKFDDTKFMNDMRKIFQYSDGFLDGVQKGKSKILDGVGKNVVDALEEYIDSSARVNPAELSHVYEWGESGNSMQRLFELSHNIKTNYVEISYQFTQSQSIKPGSNTPFTNKAEVMELGMPVTIKPVKSKLLAFEDNGEEVFTPYPVVVEHPGGMAAQGSFQKTVSEFFKTLSQSILHISGLEGRIKDLSDYTNNLSQGKSGGRAVGMTVGYKWASKVGGAL